MVKERLERAIDEWLLKQLSTAKAKHPNLSTSLWSYCSIYQRVCYKEMVTDPKSTAAYAKGTVPHQFGFSRRHVDDILEILHRFEAIYRVKALNISSHSFHFPAEYFNLLTIKTLGCEESFDIDPVRVNGQEGVARKRTN